MSVDHIKAIQNLMDGLMGANNRTPFKKLPELLGQLYASEDFAAHVAG